MALSQSTIAVSNEVLIADFVVKHTFIAQPKAPSLRRVSSDAAIRYSDYSDYEQSSQSSLASAETVSEVTDDDYSESIETSSRFSDSDSGDSSSQIALLSSVALHSDAQAAHLNAEAGKAEAQAAQLKAEVEAAELVYRKAWVSREAPSQSFATVQVQTAGSTQAPVIAWVPVPNPSLPCLPSSTTIEKMEVTVPLYIGSEGSVSPRTPTQSTTLVMRNIPSNYTRAMLLDLLDDEGFKGLYNFVYLPVDFEIQTTNCGYSVINLVDSDIAIAFLAHFSAFSHWCVMSDKVCQVTWSDKLQGLDAHVEAFRNSPVLHKLAPDAIKPVLFKDGERVAFPDPTKRIRAPRKGRCVRAPAAN
jgi:hypothetical protein